MVNNLNTIMKCTWNVR